MRLRLSLSFLCLYLVCVLIASSASFACASQPAKETPPRPPVTPALSAVTFAAPFRAMVAFEADTVPNHYVAFGDVRGYMHVLRQRGARFVHVWSSFHLGASVKEIVADDIDMDGIVDLIAVTSAGRMFIFGTNTRQLVWENTANDFRSVSTLVVDQLDADEAKELVLCADSRLVIVDGEKLLREYQSADKFTAEYMVIGDVDDDDEKEIVLDSGFVVNARTLNIEWQTDFFGTKLTLVDLDGDGVDELICESSGGALRVYDLDIRQEKAVY